MKRILTIIFWAALLGASFTPATADVPYFPALYKVTDVASDDSLNIRQDPDASSMILGAYSHDEAGIEVVSLSTDERWALVNFEGQSGWTSARFLTLMAGQPDDDLPRGMVCSGTEPFWDVEFETHTTATANWSFMGLTDGPTHYGSIWTGNPTNRIPSKFGFDMKNPAVSATGIIQTELCSDGMSDISYGFSVGIMLKTSSQRMMVDGCCSLRAPQY